MPQVKQQRINVIHESEIGAVDESPQSGIQYVYIHTDKEVDRDELEKFIQREYYYPNQVRSRYDCSGQRFVSLTKTFEYPNPHTDQNQYIVSVHWGVDI